MATATDRTLHQNESYKLKNHIRPIHATASTPKTAMATSLLLFKDEAYPLGDSECDSFGSFEDRKFRRTGPHKQPVMSGCLSLGCLVVISRPVRPQLV